MTYSISHLAKIASISTRTLRHYDEIGILKPSGHTAGGHRLYQNEQLFVLQQILLYRELGFSLHETHEIIQSDQFDVIRSLKKQKNTLKQELSRIKEIMKTIDDTVEHLIDDTPMENFKLFFSLKSEKQIKARAWLDDNMADSAQAIVIHNEEWVDSMSKDDLKQYQVDTDTLCDAFLNLIESQTPAEDPDSQKWAQWYFDRRLKVLANQLTAKELIQLIQAEINHPKARQQFDAVHPKFADYFLTAMRFFLKQK